MYIYINAYNGWVIVLRTYASYSDYGSYVVTTRAWPGNQLR
jgi:hypothetical protein